MPRWARLVSRITENPDYNRLVNWRTEFGRLANFPPAMAKHSDMASNSSTVMLYKGSTGQAAVIMSVEETPGNWGQYATAMPPLFVGPRTVAKQVDVNITKRWCLIRCPGRLDDCLGGIILDVNLTGKLSRRFGIEEGDFTWLL